MTRHAKAGVKASVLHPARRSGLGKALENALHSAVLCGCATCKSPDPPSLYANESLQGNKLYVCSAAAKEVFWYQHDLACFIEFTLSGGLVYRRA